MAFELLMPKLSSTMEVGNITQWLKQEGDTVETGEAIFEVMTDKIAIEVESYEDGILLKRYYDIDQEIPINAVIGYIGEVGEEVPEKAPTPPNQVAPEAIVENEVDSLVDQEQKIASQEKVRATPAARKLAHQKGIELQAVSGSGTNGRIHVVDVEQYQPTALVVNEETLIPWRGMRKAIADSMVKSKSEKPHVTMNAEVAMSEVIKLREALLPLIEEQTGYRVSYTEIIIKAVTTALKQYPSLNALTKEDGIHQFSQVNMGVAVSLADGLVVPVIPQANRLGLGELTVATKEAALKARQGNLPPESLKGGTFTISSLGNSAVRSFNPVINAPEVAILGVGGLYDVPSLDKDGQLEMAKHLTLSLSFDHRAIDGAPAASFLTTVVGLLEEPYKLLV